MNILSADLNLLVALDALLQERNVTRAGARIGVSQSAMSSALEPAPAAVRRRIVDQGRHPLRTDPVGAGPDRSGRRGPAAHREDPQRATDLFEPATSTREFRVVGSDYALTPADAVPDVDAETAGPAGETAAGVGAAHRGGQPGGIAPLGRSAADPARDISPVCRSRTCSATGGCASPAPTTPGPIEPYTLDDVGELRWARAFAPVSATLADRQIDDLVDFGQHTDVVVDTFSMLPPAVSGTTLYAMVQERLVRECLDRYRLRIVELPVEFAPLRRSGLVASVPPARPGPSVVPGAGPAGGLAAGGHRPRTPATPTDERPSPNLSGAVP